MKKVVFKKWVNWLVFGLMILSVFTLAGECESTLMFIATKGIACLVLVVGFKLLSRFGRKEIL